MMKATDRILFLLKTRGPQTTRFLADDLELTSMGARRHLDSLLEEGLLGFQEHSQGPGRPTRYWELTGLGHQRFPDRHSDLNLQLIQQVKSIFGDEGLNRLIEGREHQARHLYQARMAEAPGLAAKIAALAAVRREEGYMAEVQPGEAAGNWLLIENHCPICAAARECQNFCRSELALFQQLLHPEATVQREDHILAGARRCAYRIVAV